MAGGMGRVCPHCGQAHPEGTLYCPVTGLRLAGDTRTCPSCGYELSPAQESCPNCGSWIGLPQPAEATAADEAVPVAEVQSEPAAAAGQEAPPSLDGEPEEEVAAAAIPDQDVVGAAPPKTDEPQDELPAGAALAAILPQAAETKPLPSEQMPAWLQALQPVEAADQPEGYLPLSPPEPALETPTAGAGQAAEPAPARKRSPAVWLIPLGVAICCIVSGLLGYLWSGYASPEPTQVVALPTLTEPIRITPLAAATSSPMPSQTATELPTATATSTPVPRRTPTRTATRQPTRTPQPSATPTASAEWEACPGTYLSRLRIGDQGYISYSPPLANNVREQAGLDAPLIGKLQPGEELLVVDGPECENNWVWWFVRSRKTGLQGWTAEGDRDGYWIVPAD